MKIPTLALTILLTLPATALTKTHVLTIGGGQAPSNNQVSLEKNVLFFNKLIAEQLPPDTTHDVLFADGTSPNADLQFQPEPSPVPEANALMAALYGSTRYLHLQYRNNELPNVTAASTPAAVEHWFEHTAPTLQSGDRLVLYITAHGGKSPSKDNPHNTKIYTWNWASIDANQLSELIGKLPGGVSVVTVMVQCFAGGFSHLIFDGDKHRDRDICGFYATTCDREAAGCTPDINEEDYDEYSSHFWAALRGTTRMGKPVETSDFDGDGKVSFAEAHAHTLITSKNIDVPVKTSDAFLRRHSQQRDDEHPDLLSRDTPYFQLLTHASPAELAVLDTLSHRLDLTGNDRAKTAAENSKEITDQRKKLADEDKEKKRTFDSLRRTIGNDIKLRWPNLANPLSPAALHLLHKHPDQFVAAIKDHPKYNDWNNVAKRRKAITSERFALDKKWAHHQRFLRTLENIALAQNLPKLADDNTQTQFNSLVAAESSNLTAHSPPQHSE